MVRAIKDMWNYSSKNDFDIREKEGRDTAIARSVAPPQLQIVRWMGKSGGKDPATVSTRWKELFTTIAGSRALAIGYIKILFNTFF